MHKLVIPVYAVYSASLLLAKLPIWIFQYSFFPSTRGRQSWTLSQQLLVNFLRNVIRITVALGSSVLKDIDAPLLANNTLAHSHAVELQPVDKKYLKGIIVKAANDVGGLDPVLKNGTGRVGPRKIPAYWYSGKKDKNAELAPLSNTDDDVILLYLHGGGYLFGSAHETDGTANIAKDLLKKSPIKRVLSVEYRLSGLGPFPAALIDALSGYSYLVDDCKIPAHRILIGGDSAGANLTLALTRYLRDEKVFDMPAGLILLSPWGDMTQSHWKEGASAFTNIKSDYVDADFGNKGVEQYLKGHSKSMRYDPYISPASTFNTDKQSFAGFPSTFISAGGAEALLDEIVFLKSKMVESIGKDKVTLEVTEDAPHDFLLFKWGKTRGEAIQTLADWVAEQFPNASRPKQVTNGSQAKKDL